MQSTKHLYKRLFHTPYIQSLVKNNTKMSNTSSAFGNTTTIARDLEDIKCPVPRKPTTSVLPEPEHVDQLYKRIYGDDGESVIITNETILDAANIHVEALENAAKEWK